MDRIRALHTTDFTSVLIAQVRSNAQHPVGAQDPVVAEPLSEQGISDVIPETKYVRSQGREIATGLEI